MRPATSSCSKSRTAAAGTSSRSPRRCRWSTEALRGGPGPFALQAAIAALHCQAARAEDTDWPQILRLYDLLERVQPSPIVSLNRAVAVAMVDGPRAGARADRALAAPAIWTTITCCMPRARTCCAASESPAKPRESYARALELVTNDSERRFLERRLKEVQSRKA